MVVKWSLWQSLPSSSAMSCALPVSEPYETKMVLFGWSILNGRGRGSRGQLYDTDAPSLRSLFGICSDLLWTWSLTQQAEWERNLGWGGSRVKTQKSKLSNLLVERVRWPGAGGVDRPETSQRHFTYQSHVAVRGNLQNGRTKEQKKKQMQSRLSRALLLVRKKRIVPCL